MKETLTLLERCQQDIKENALKETTATLSEDGLSYGQVLGTIYRFTEEELNEAIANTLKQAAEEIGRLKEMYEPAFGKANQAYTQALTDAQKMLTGDSNENV